MISAGIMADYRADNSAIIAVPETASLNGMINRLSANSIGPATAGGTLMRRIFNLRGAASLSWISRSALKRECGLHLSV